jgi:hypothetical protein
MLAAAARVHKQSPQVDVCAQGAHASQVPAGCMQQSHPPGTSCVKDCLLPCLMLAGRCRGCTVLLDFEPEGLAIVWQCH